MTTTPADTDGTPITINGTAYTTTAKTLTQLVVEYGTTGAFATAVNGSFVPAAQRDSTPIAAGDAIEILAPTQGG